MSSEKNYIISFNVYDNDKMSSNDFIAQVDFPLADLVNSAPTPDPETGLYKLTEFTDAKGPTSAPTSVPIPPPAPEDKDLKNYAIPLKMSKEGIYEDKHNPTLIINAKYVPYTALRQQLWRCLLSQYDVDDSGRLTRVELVTMLDSLGSTLSEKTINGFFRQFRQNPEEPHIKEAEEITIDQAVFCLEDQLSRQSKGPTSKEAVSSKSAAPSASTDPSTIDIPEKDGTPSNPSNLALSTQESDSNGSDGNGLADPDDKSGEHVIMITECPLCHQPRLNKRSETDIVTHLATCASQDWKQVDRFVMGGFVTSDQAHRKWYSKV
jgi:phosphatidylserine decarboxylase